MADMLVKLYDLRDDPTLFARLEADGIRIKQALSPDKHRVLAFIRENFGEGWASECDAAFANQPVSCFIAVKEKQVVGFGCYEATARDYFGPTGVREDMRGKGIGKAILLKCMAGLANLGYAYAIIGSAAATAVEFYKKTVGAAEIEGSAPGVYARMIDHD